jgi:hypothetical protein
MLTILSNENSLAEKETALNGAQSQNETLKKKDEEISHLRSQIETTTSNLKVRISAKNETLC